MPGGDPLDLLPVPQEPLADRVGEPVPGSNGSTTPGDDTPHSARSAPTPTHKAPPPGDNLTTCSPTGSTPNHRTGDELRARHVIDGIRTLRNLGE